MGYQPLLYLVTSSPRTSKSALLGLRASGQEIYVQDADTATSAAEWDEVRQPRSVNPSWALGQPKTLLAPKIGCSVGGFLLRDLQNKRFLRTV